MVYENSYGVPDVDRETDDVLYVKCTLCNKVGAAKEAHNVIKWQFSRLFVGLERYLSNLST